MTLKDPLTSRPGREPLRHAAAGLLIALMASIALLGLGQTPASAASLPQRCTGQVHVNVCLRFDQLDANRYNVHVGIDFRITKSQAEEIILNAGGNPYHARLFGVAREPVGNQEMFDIPATSLGASDEAGLSADFDVIKTRSELNKDPYPWPFTFSKVFARIDLVQPGAQNLIFNSDSFPQNF